MTNNARMSNISYTIDFSNKNYAGLYVALLKAGVNDINDETVCLVDLAQFGSLYLIICFNLSHHESYTDMRNLMI